MYITNEPSLHGSPPRSSSQLSVTNGPAPASIPTAASTAPHSSPHKLLPDRRRSAKSPNRKVRSRLDRYLMRTQRPRTSSLIGLPAIASLAIELEVEFNVPYYNKYVDHSASAFTYNIIHYAVKCRYDFKVRYCFQTFWQDDSTIIPFSENGCKLRTSISAVTCRLSKIPKSERKK